MNTKNQILHDDDIDLKEIILKLWKEKFLIFIITSVFTFAGYIYSIVQPKTYQTTITISQIPSGIFEKYDPYFLRLHTTSKNNEMNASSAFEEIFELNLKSFDNMENFVSQNKQQEEYKFFLNNNFQSFLKATGSQNRYNLNYLKSFAADQYLNNYVIYAFEISQNVFNKSLINSIENDIINYKQSIEIAKKINLENPMVNFIQKINNNIEPGNLFYKGTKVLSQQLSYLEELLEQTRELKLNYNPIFEKANTRAVFKSELFLITIAFILGLLFSFIVVFFKTILIK